MPIYGEALKIRFSTTQQHGPVANDIPADASASEPDIAVIAAEVDALFVGQLLNLSVQKYAMTQAEKDLALNNCIARYSRFGVSGTYWQNTQFSKRVPFYLAGVGQYVTPNIISAFVQSHFKMMDGGVPDNVFVGGFRRIE